MAFVGRILVAFVVENMTDVTSASSAADLSARHSHGVIVMKRQSTLNRLEESRPATTRVKFGFALVKRRITASTVINALVVELVVFAYII